MAGAIFWNLIFALSSSLTAFIIVWCMCRYFLSMGWGGLTKTIGNWYPPERNGTIMGLISVNFQFGGIAATLFAAFLVYRNVSWQGLFIYPALVLTAIFVWSAIFSKSSPKDVLPDVTLSKGDDEKAQIADYGEENEPSIKVIIKALLGLPIYRQLLFSASSQPCFAQSFSSGPRCSSLTSALTFLIQYYNQRFFRFSEYSVQF